MTILFRKLGLELIQVVTQEAEVCTSSGTQMGQRYLLMVLQLQGMETGRMTNQMGTGIVY